MIRDMIYGPLPSRLRLPAELLEAIAAVALAMIQPIPQDYREKPRRRAQRGGATLRPGRATPLWNELRAQLQPHLRQYGQQVKLGRLVGLPRQRINAFVTGGGEMPDAERTLQLLAWLMAVRQGKRPG